MARNWDREISLLVFFGRGRLGIADCGGEDRLNIESKSREASRLKAAAKYLANPGTPHTPQEVNSDPNTEIAFCRDYIARWWSSV